MSPEKCSSKRDGIPEQVVGRARGSCAQGFGVCCVHVAAITGGSPVFACNALPGHDSPCETSSRQLSSFKIQEKIIYLQNPSFPLSDESNGEEVLTLVPRDEDVVQFRLDFVTFEEMSHKNIKKYNKIAQPIPPVSHL